MLSPAQQKTLNVQLWPDAAKAQGWPHTEAEARAQGFASVRAFRLHTLGQIVNRALGSSNEIGTGDEFTLVKNRLLKLANDIQGAHEDGDPTGNDLRTRRWVALRDIRCLRLYVDEAYVREILNQRFARAGICPTVFGHLPLPRIIAEFKSVPVLNELLSTLNQRLHANPKNQNLARGFRVKAGHSMHDMLTAAGLHCACKDCARGTTTDHRPQTTDHPSEAEAELVHAGAESEPF